MAMFESIEEKEKQQPKPRFNRWMLGAGLALMFIAIIWHPALLFGSSDWTTHLHYVEVGARVVLGVAGFIVVIKAQRD